MKKHFSKALALLLALVMVLSMLPTMSFAGQKISGEGFLDRAPEDDSYGVLYACGEGYGTVLSADPLNDVFAAAKAAEPARDGAGLKQLPEEAVVFRFLKTGAADGSYYLMVQGKYLAMQDKDGSLTLADSISDAGTKWLFDSDRAGKVGSFNLRNARKLNGREVCLRAVENGFSCETWSAAEAAGFQLQVMAATEHDSLVRAAADPGHKPIAGETVVIYNKVAKGVFGQPTGPDQAKPNLTIAPATLTNDSLRYKNIGDGGLILKVGSADGYYTFQTGDKYLACSENYTSEDGKTANDECLILIDELTEYAKWTLEAIDGGWKMVNKTAKWGSSSVVAEVFGNVFCGYSYYSDQPEKYAMRFYRISDRYKTGYVVNPSVSIIKNFIPAVGRDCAVKFQVNDLSDLTETVAEYWFDDNPANKKTAQFSYDGKLGTMIVPAADMTADHTILNLQVTCSDVWGKTYSTTASADVVDAPMIVDVAPAAHSGTGEVLRPEISVTFFNAGADPEISLRLDGEEVTGTVAENRVSYTPAQDLAQGKHSVSFRVTRADGKTASKNWTFFIGEVGEVLYFGQIHAHTAEYSDGAGTLEQAYEHAHDVDDLDYIIITDHSNYFDTTATATTSSYYDLASLSQTADGSTTKWEEARATAKAYNEMWSDFVCMYGYEMTWSGGPGHTNTFNTYGTVSRNNTELNNKVRYAGMHRYNDLMVNADRGLDVEGKEAKITRDGAEVTGVNATKYIPFGSDGEPVPVVSQFNHPGVTFGNFDDFAGRTTKRDDVLNLIEVGNGEGEVGGSAYFPSYEQYDLCLSMGWHVGPTNNQDNHKGNWGSSNTCRDVILTDDFSEVGIYRALDARRIYSTEDQNLEIYYEMEAAGQLFKMGDIAPFEDDNQPETVKLIVSVEDPDATDSIARVQVIGESGRVLRSLEISAGSWSGEIEVPNDENGYYYIKVVEGDGDIAVTAPVWTKTAVPVASDVVSSASVAAQGEEETVTATLTNGSDEEPVTLVSYKITAEDRVLEEKNDLSETLAPESEKVITLPFVPENTDPPAKKSYEIKAEFTFIYKGKTLTVEKTVVETSYPPELMTFIGLDKGHTNFYVSGDYANNDGSFIEICAERGILCQYIDAGKMTKENLKKYKAIVLTVPRVNEATAPTVWTEEELEAIADYAANGGSIINLSKSDRYDYSKKGQGDVFDTYEFASATLSNLINEAVGAKTRFVRGIVVDNAKKSNEAYRINFNGRDLLGDHVFTQGVFPSTNGQYQFYNGTGITIEEGATDVTTLVAPYDSTWISCYKGYPGHPGDYFTGSSFIPSYEKAETVMAEKGTFSLVTAEPLSGGGFLVCAGACFISNYDLKVGTASNKQYENYALVCNILDYIKDGEFDGEVTPIKDVHNGEVGQEFTIEGTVTSNASDYDKDTAFFDCIYVQDETRGINCFPVSGYYYIGEKVRVHGGVTYYCGEIELNLSPQYNGSIQVISNDVTPLEAKKVKCKTAMSDANIGNLVKVKGVITDIHRTAGVIDYIYVDDGSGEEATLFINAYIQKDYPELEKAEVGMMCEGIGIGSRDVDESSGGADGQITVDDPSLYIKRLRVRARDEIRCYVDPCTKFTDVKRESWYHDGVDYALNTGIMAGLSDTTFGPNGTLTRAQAVAILYRLAGSPEVSIDNPFTDNKPGKYYYKAVLWALENNITAGTSDTKFSPNGTVTREQLASFVYRYAKHAGFDVSAQADLTGFPDLNKLSKYARTPMAWAVAVGLISGEASGGTVYLRPKNNTTRAQVASILMRFDRMDVENKNDIVILFTNDVHCAINNTEDSFGYAGLAALKKDMESKHDYVGLVDSGDFIQGGPIGSLTKGAKIISIMNKMGYDAVTLGNHEFDYGVSNILELTEQAEFDIVNCNWKYIGPEGGAGQPNYAPYKIVSYGDVKVAFVGIATPETMVKSTPTYFQDEDGNWIYDFCNDESGYGLYEAVQEAVDAAKAEGADYVIALAHLGTDAGSFPWRSTDLILETSGIDVVLDGHSHSVITADTEFNWDDEEVLLSSTGTKLANVGKLTITRNGELKTELISRENYDAVDEEMQTFLDGVNAEFEELLNQVVVEGLTKDLTISNPNRLDETGKPIRAVRYQETNLGDVCADAYVYATGADIGFVNGGGVRADIPAGDVTYGQIIEVHPFGNELCVVEATGQQILDALEMAARKTFLTPEGLPDGEEGGFLQVSGLKYTIYTGTDSTVAVDATGMFQEVKGGRRVGTVQVLNKTTGEYEPIDPEKTYTLASHDYMLMEGGDGLSMFKNCNVIPAASMLDNEVLINYFNSDLFRERLAAGLYDSWDGNFARITISSEERPADGGSQGDDEDALYVLTGELQDGDEVVIYNPGRARAIRNDNHNDWYLKAAEVTVEDNQVVGPAEDVIWTVHVDEEGNYSFSNGENKIVMWLSGNYAEVTNNADYPGADPLWNLVPANAENQSFYIRSKTIKHATKGDGYLECFEKTVNEVKEPYITGYFSTAPTERDYAFQFYRKTLPAYHLSASVSEGDKVVIYNPGRARAIRNDNHNDWYLKAAEVTIEDNQVVEPAEDVIWTVHVDEEGNYSFSNGENKIVMWLSGNYAEVTNNADYPGADPLWNLVPANAENQSFYIRSKTIKHATKGDGYLECFEKTVNEVKEPYITGYFSTAPTERDYAFQFYVYGVAAETGTMAVYTADLEALIAQAEALDLTKYTEESVAAFNQALAAARAVMAKENKTQAEVNEATNALRAAIEGLIEKTVLTPGAYNLTTTLKGGDQVIIYCPAAQKAMSGTISNSAVTAVAATVNAGVITSADAGIYTVEYPEGDNVNFLLKDADGKYLTSGATGSSMALEGTPNEYSLWYLEVKNEAAQKVFIRSTNAVYKPSNGNPKPQALEYFDGLFKTYSWQDSSIFIFQLFVLIPEE